MNGSTKEGGNSVKKKSIGLTLLLLCFMLVTGVFAGMYGRQEASAATKGTVTADGLRVRTGAGTNKAVLTHEGANVFLSKGTSVTIKSEKKVSDVTWYKVTFTYQGEKLTGYISGDYVKVKAVSEDTSGNSSSTGTSGKVTISKGLTIPAKITATNVNVRKGASTSNSKLTVNGKNVSLKKGTSVKIIKEVMNGNQKWYYVSFTYNKVTQKGYVLSDYAKLVLSKEISAKVYGAENVKFRTGASESKSYKKVNGKTVTAKEGTELRILSEKTASDGTKWFKVSLVFKDTVTKGFIPANNVVLKEVVPVQAKVTTNNLRVRTGAGTNHAHLTIDGKKISLQAEQVVTVKAQTKVADVTWYKVSFEYNDTSVTGYISGDYAEIVDSSLKAPEVVTPEEPDDTTGEGTNTENSGATNEEGTDVENPGNTTNDGNNSENQGGSTNGDTNTGNGSDGEASGGNAGTIQPAEPIADIDAHLAEQNFPESYKAGLKALHKAHPTWIFKAYHTGLTWEEAVASESKVGLNLITNNKANGWKSYETKAYNYATDKFTVYDGSTWVSASKEAVAYYMDPRNFMTERGIFQFLTLEYQSSYENRNGVEAILANTPLYNKQYTYLDETTEQEITKYYSDTFVEAAVKSGVSPYHLATRVKQEVVSNSSTLSGSATGTFSGYEGYYNYYNIGATHSTAAGGAIANGLNFAMGNKSDAAAKAAYMLPWNNPYKGIVGGASYIGSQYINRGQNTIYLQKFNVTPTSTYAHQYMANVEAANSEAIKLYNGYASVLDTSLVFYIPVYENMPEEKADVPGSIPSPNNWLKSLTVDEYNFVPLFDAASGSGQVYVLNLEEEEVTAVTLKAVTANTKAKVQIDLTAGGTTTTVANTGSVKLNLVTGLNEVSIVVTAENGDVNTYKLTIMK